MPSRDVMDERIDVWKDHYKDLQRDWRTTSSTTGNYGQVLPGNVKPSDQLVDGPQLPPNLRDEGRIDVEESPEGFSWLAFFEATEGPQVYYKYLSCLEDGPIVEAAWLPYLAPPLPGPPNFLLTAWNATKRFFGFA